jgi:anti-sigma factor RsiW
MAETDHIHEDDLELYCAGRLEPERVAALEAHFPGCQDCQKRLHQCVGPQLNALRRGHA